eukprot:scaffold67609_cov70-Phaeocystis_antarctica.AAC.2
MSHLSQVLARLAPAAPAEKEEHGQGDAYEGCQRRCRCVPALHACRLTRVKVPRAIGDVADSAVGPGGPWLARHAVCIRTRCRVGRGRIGAAPQIGAATVCAPVPRYQGKQSQSGSRLLALGSDRAWLARHLLCGGFAVVVLFLTLAVFDACRALARLGKPRALLARASVDLIDQRLVGVNATRNSQASRAPRTHRASLTVTGTRQVFATTDLASFTSGWGGASGGAPGRFRARLACLITLLALKAACSTPVARTHLGVGRDRARAARRLVGAARGCKVALVRLRALVNNDEDGGVRIRAFLARQRRAGPLGTKRARLAGDACLLALALLVRACRALDASGHARVWRDRAGAALTRLRRARTARRSRWALQAVVGARHREVELQHRLVLVSACLARQRGRRALRAVRAGRARPAHQLARRGLEGAGLALETRAHACVERDRAGATGRLLGATGWRKVARVGLGALAGAGEAGGVGV